MLQSKLTIALSSIYHTLSNATVPANTAQYYAKGTLEDVSVQRLQNINLIYHYHTGIHLPSGSDITHSLVSTVINHFKFFSS